MWEIKILHSLFKSFTHVQKIKLLKLWTSFKLLIFLNSNPLEIFCNIFCVCKIIKKLILKNFQNMLSKSWLCINLRTYAQILCLFFLNDIFPINIIFNIIPNVPIFPKNILFSFSSVFPLNSISCHCLVRNIYYLLFSHVPNFP